MEQRNLENEYANVEPPPGFAPLSSLSSAPPGFSQSVSQSSQPFYQHNPHKPRNEKNHTKTLLQQKKKVKVIINFLN